MLRRIVLDIQGKMFAEAISQALSECAPSFVIARSDTPEDTVALCKADRAHILIMEVTGYPPWRLEERLRLRNELKKHLPECKIVLLADENADAALAESVKQAKKDGLIDSFIYSSVSPSYLAAMLDAL